jgi:hypothetical protein
MVFKKVEHGHTFVCEFCAAIEEAESLKALLEEAVDRIDPVFDLNSRWSARARQSLGKRPGGATIESHANNAIAEIAALRARVEVLEGVATAARAAAFELASQFSGWKPGIGIVPPTKAYHGSCCCCQVCGRHHDDCVCEHNEIETKYGNVLRAALTTPPTTGQTGGER